MANGKTDDLTVGMPDEESSDDEEVMQNTTPSDASCQNVVLTSNGIRGFIGLGFPVLHEREH